MTEWWTYRPSDFLMFSARTYRRLFELYNAEVWPALVPALGLGVGLLLLAWRAAPHTGRGGPSARAPAVPAVGAWEAGCLILAACWLGDSRRLAGLGLLFFAVLLQPLVGRLLGRPWTQAEVFGLAPDPTAVGTLGWLLLRPRRRRDDRGRRCRVSLAVLLWPVPWLWCMVSGLTLWTMQAADAALLPCAALLAGFVAACTRDNRLRSPPPKTTDPE